MPKIVPPVPEGNPPVDGLTVSGKRKALLLLEQIKNEIAAVEDWVQTVPDKPGTDAPSPAPPPPQSPSKPTKAGKKYRPHH